MQNNLSFGDAAFEVLKTAKKPMKPKDIIEVAISRRLLVTKSRRPEATLNPILHGDRRFLNVSRGLWQLKGKP